MNPELTVIVGSMFSGKSTALIRLLERAAISGKDTILVKPTIDNRFSETEVVTHGGSRLSAFAVPDSASLQDITKDLIGSNTIVGIDEVQFFDEKVIAVIDNLVNSRNVPVVAAGLDLDFKEMPWKVTSTLMSLADNLIKERAVCKICGNDASRSQRLVSGAPVTTGSVIQVGGQESYEARCRHCFVR